MHRFMLLLPFQTSLVPHRWKRTVQTMLEKDPGHPWIHRLRIIELFDSQVNAGFQIFIGRKMVWEAVKQKKLHSASYGSTPGKMASSAVLQKVISVDQLRIERRAGGLFDCDATGCYDRIIPPLAGIHLQALGLDETISTFLARFMFMAQRFVKTKHGVSQQSIRTTTKEPLYGIGQGNGGGPAIWLAHLTVMFTALASICEGLWVGCLKGLEYITAVGTGYVDDVTLVVSVHPEEEQTESLVRTKLRKMATTWEKLLYITGGKLELSKCFWIPITWQWRKGNAIMCKEMEGSRALILKESESGKRITIPRIGPATAEKRLGIWFSLNGQWLQEYKQWKLFTTKYAMRIRTARLDRLGGYHSYSTLWCAKFRYCAPVISFSSSQLEHLQKIITGNCLAAAGYCSKMPRAVVFGPAELGGMSWDSAYGIMVYEQIKLLLGSLRMEDTVGKLLRLQLQWLQIFSGTSTPILEAKQVTEYLPRGWLQSLHEKLVENNIQIKVDKQWRPKPRRDNDRIIMDYVRRHLPRGYWEPINQCRLYLKAVTFSDITTFDGQYIPESIYLVKEAYRTSILRFPIQPRPSKKARQQWQYFVRYVSTEKGKLYLALGNWIRPPYQKYPFAVAHRANLLYKKLGNKWEVYYLQQGTRNVYNRGNVQVEKLPKKWTPINVIRMSNGVVKGILPEALVRTAEKISSIGNFAEDTWKLLLGKFEINSTEMQKLSEIWHSGHIALVCGSDGGLKSGIGTSAYILYLAGSEDPVVYGYAAEKQYEDNPSSTRQELLAQLSVEYWVNHFIGILGEPKETINIQLVTDSQASIMIREKMSNLIGMKDFLRPDVDVAMEIDHYRRLNNCSQLEIIKVRSHIDIDDAPNEFFWKVNDEADTLATRAREQVEQGRLDAREPNFLPAAKAVCVIKGTIALSNLKEQVNSAISYEAMKEYLCTKNDWSTRTFDLINWSAHHAALHKYKLVQRVTVMKLVHGWLATKKRKWREGRFETPSCVLCQEEETNNHMYYCSHEGLQNRRLKEWNILMEKVRKLTELDTVVAISIGLSNESNHSPVDIYKNEFAPSRALRVAMQDQQDIGWEQIWSGRIAKGWMEVGPREDLRATPEIWAKQIVSAFLDFGIILWKLRNKVIHGDGGGPSILESWKTSEMIHTLYEELAPQCHKDNQWLFSATKENKLREPHAVQIAWVDSVRRLYPRQYQELRNSVGTIDFKHADMEYYKATSSSISGV